MWPTREVRRWIEDHVAGFAPEVVLFGSPYPLALLGPDLKRRTGLPYVVIAHGAEVTVPTAIPGLRRAIARSLQSADTVFAVSEFTADRAARLSPGNVALLGAGVDIEVFRPRSHQPTGDSASWSAVAAGTMAEIFTLGCVGRFVPRKGQTRVLRAAAELQSRGHRIDVLMVGWGRHERRLRRLATRLGVPTRFEISVPWDVLPEMYRQMDAFAMPARTRWFGLEFEGLGICYLEAAATRIPVVAGSSGGAPETVEQGRTGFVADSVAGIVEAVELLLTDPARVLAMGAAGRERISSDYTWELVMDRFRRGLAALTRQPVE